jgi:hypothetical protein
VLLGNVEYDFAQDGKLHGSSLLSPGETYSVASGLPMLIGRTL